MRFLSPLCFCRWTSSQRTSSSSLSTRATPTGPVPPSTSATSGSNGTTRWDPVGRSMPSRFVFLTISSPLFLPLGSCELCQAYSVGSVTMQLLRGYLQSESLEKKKVPFDFTGWEDYCDHTVRLTPSLFFHPIFHSRNEPFAHGNSFFSLSLAFRLQVTPQQMNGFDCGVFACQILEAVSRGGGYGKWTFSQESAWLFFLHPCSVPRSF
jgi:hypothetical protein